MASGPVVVLFTSEQRDEKPIDLEPSQFQGSTCKSGRGHYCSTFEKCEEFHGSKTGAKKIYLTITTHVLTVPASKSMHPALSIFTIRNSKHPTLSIWFPVCDNVYIANNSAY